MKKRNLNAIKISIHILLALLLIACGGSSNIPSDVNWTIIKEEPVTALSKNTIEIKLNKKVDERILKEIALEIRKDNKQYEKLWIYYHITDIPSEVAWANTHFTPELKVQILGLLETEVQNLTKSKEKGDEIIGKWESNYMGATLVLYQNQKRTLSMKVALKDGSTMNSEVVESTKQGKTKYQDDNEHGEYYLLESNGNLGMYGNNGKFDEAIKIE